MIAIDLAALFCRRIYPNFLVLLQLLLKLIILASPSTNQINMAAKVVNIVIDIVITFFHFKPPI